MASTIRVVGAVIVQDGAVLCARRAGTGPLAGMWEFPGGKVEPGESAAEALLREIQEELGCGLNLGAHICTTTFPYDFATIELTTHLCTLTDGEPQLTDHSEIRWLLPTNISELAWAPADLPTVAWVKEII